MGRTVPPILTANARRLKLQDPRCVRKYISYLTETLCQQDVPQQLSDLFASAQHWGYLTLEQQAHYNSLDLVISLAFLSAERQCRKFHSGVHSWSPQYQQLWNSKKLLHGVLKYRRDDRPIPCTLRRKLLSHNLHHCLTWSISDIETEYQHSLSTLQQFHQKAQETRETFLESLSRARALETSTTPSFHFRQLITRKTTRRNARILKLALSSTHRGPLTIIDAPSPTPTDPDAFTRCVTKDTMETAMLHECRTCFRQASDTPFLRSPLFDLVGPLGVSSGSQQILDGLTPPDLPPLLTKFLQQLHRVTPHSLSILPSLDSFRWHWQRQRESRSSHPGRHFGHIMACMKSDTLTPILYHLECTPLLSGFSPSSWQHATDVMIEKQPGNFLTTKMTALPTMPSNK